MNPIDADLWLAQRIAKHTGRDPVEVVSRIFGGTSEGAVRRERFRVAILEFGLADMELGEFDGTRETYRQAFERRYGIALASGQDATPNAAGFDMGGFRTEGA